MDNRLQRRYAGFVGSGLMGNNWELRLALAAPGIEAGCSKKATEARIALDTRLATDKVAEVSDCCSMFAIAIAGRDVPEQRSDRIVLCDAAWRVHSSV